MSARRLGAAVRLRSPGRLGADYASQVLSDAPLFWHRYREASGSVFADSSGNSRPGALVGSGITYSNPGPIRSDGAASKAIKITGSTYDNTPYAAYMDTANYTYEVWLQSVSTAQPNNAGLMGRFSGSGGGVNAQLLWFSTTPVAEMAAKTNVNTFRAASPGSASGPGWVHWVGTWDGTTVKLYCNGLLLASTGGGSGTTTTGAGDFQIGTYQSTAQSLSNHLLAEGAIYGTALSADRIAAHYNAALGLAA